MGVGRPAAGARRARPPSNRLARSPSRAPAPPRLPLEDIWTQSLLRRLRSRFVPRLELRVTDNVHTMLSFRRRTDRLEVRLHHMFLAAPDSVVDALARYIRGSDPTASAVLDRFILEHRWLIRRVPPHVRRERIAIQAAGRHHDLGAILGRLQREYAAGRSPCEITWGAAPRVTLPRRSIKLGSYSADAQLIRIHPALDQEAVPGYFVEWIVFHELLHHLHGISRKAGRRCVHSPAFVAAERRFPSYERARRWEQENIDLLLWWQPSAAAPPPRALGRLRAALVHT